jgi:sugar lactone lactonase YvrE
MRTLTTGLGLLESPRWHDGQLWVSGLTAGLIHAIDPAGPAGVTEAVLEHRSLPTCFDFATGSPADDPVRGRLTAFDVDADGSLSNRRVWADLDGHSPDGICLDDDGAAWYADVGDRCCARVREGGEVLDRVQLDHTDWYGTVLAVSAPAPGVGWPGAGAA